MLDVQQKNSDDDDLISTLIIVSSLFSIFSCGIVLYQFFLNRSPNNSIFFITQICFCDFSYSLIFFIIAIGNLSVTQEISKVECNIQGFFRNFFELSSYFWTFIITVMILREVTCAPNHRVFDNKYFWSSICYIPSAILAIVPIIFNAYELVYPLSKVNCSITTHHDNYSFSWLQFICFQIPFFIIIFLDGVFLTVSMIFIKKYTKLTLKQLKPFYFLYFIPLILFITWIWMFINRIINTLNKESRILDIIEYPLVCLNGFLDSLIYAKFKMNNFSKLFCPCFQRQKQISIDDNQATLTLTSSSVN